MSLIENLGQVAPVSGPESRPVRAAPAAAPVNDQVEIAMIPLTTQVQELHADTPPSYQAVLGTAVRELRAAASQSTDPVEAAYLSGLAARFQRLEESGDPAK